MIAAATKSQRLAFGFAVAGILFAQSPLCLAAVYKCTGPDGKLTYGDTPCAADENSQQVTITPAPLHMAPAPTGIQSFPATRNREVGVQVCTGKAFNEWQKAQGPNLPNPHATTEKLSEIRNQCLRQFGLPELQPVKSDPALECRKQRFAEYMQAHAKTLPPLQVQIAKEAEIYDECKRSLGAPATTDPPPIQSPRAITQKVSAASEQPPPSATSSAVAGLHPETNRDPSAVLNALADRIYVIGETSGKVTDMIAAESSAADEIRHYLSGGSTDGLLAKEKGQQSPLAAAAYMGYPNVVAALLTSDVVRAHINDAEEKGVTPWIAANLSMRQSLLACNPSIWDDPFKFVPMLVTQPYYLSNPAPPYAKTREVLEKAGATSDSSKAKETWLTLCKNQSPQTRTKVQASANLQKTVQELGAADLMAKVLELQKKAAEAQKK